MARPYANQPARVQGNKTRQCFPFPASETSATSTLEWWESQSNSSSPEFVKKEVFLESHAAKLLADQGVPLMIGTDVPNPWVVPGFSVIDEMKLREEAGISRIEVLRAAITAPPRFLNLEKIYGAIQPNFRANFLILETIS